MAYSAPPTVSPGDAITAALWNTYIRDNQAALLNPPSARVYHNAAQSLANSVATVVAFNSERWDTDTIHDTVTNNSRLTCKTAGRYLIIGTTEYATNATGVRETYIRLNGATPLAADVRAAVSGLTTAFTIQTYWDMAVNDYVELIAFQSSGGALNLNSTANYSPEFMMTRVG